MHFARLAVAAVVLAAGPVSAGTLTQFDATGAHVLGTDVRSAGIAFGPAGQVLVVVDTAGTLTQFDATGSHVLGAGVASVGIAFAPSGEVLEIIDTAGVL